MAQRVMCMAKQWG